MFLLLFNTIKYLKIRQIFFQLIYRIKKVKPLFKYQTKFNFNGRYISFSDFLTVRNTANSQGIFNFLNQEVKFSDGIDWNFMDNGKLWNYNLHYANYLLQEDISFDTRLMWLNDLHQQLNCKPDGLEPYPVSLRIINTIRFISRHRIDNLHLLQNVSAEANFLSARIEYHLLGNHVLENGFSLLLAGAFFEHAGWIEQAHLLLIDQLSEQILDDGAHFELSPMYHQIILYRILELIDWYANWQDHNKDYLYFFTKKAQLMLSWLKNITFKNGDIPLMNDSANGVTYTSKELFEYAEYLNIQSDSNLQLSVSGYRAFRRDRYECIIDVGKISANYQPGHGHSDALSFILYVDGLPLFSERGTSTYQIGKTRLLERSTSAHNTLIYKNQNQSEIWSGFRVGRRAEVEVLNETNEVLEASHNGYKRYGGIHKRIFMLTADRITIQDQFLTREKFHKGDCIVNFHFHPDVVISIDGKDVLINSILNMRFVGAEKLETEIYRFASEFNKYEEGILLKVTMQASLETTIYFG
jgi:hypothetical protein